MEENRKLGEEIYELKIKLSKELLNNKQIAEKLKEKTK